MGLGEHPNERAAGAPGGVNSTACNRPYNKRN